MRGFLLLTTDSRMGSGGDPPGGGGVEPDVILITPPFRWEAAKARQGFSAGPTDPCREAGLVAGKSWRKQLLW